MKTKDRLIATIFKVVMWRLRRKLWPPFVEASRNPALTQNEVLQRIVATNADTVFGRKHGFESIKSASDFRRAVPIQYYESLRPYIEDQEQNGTAALTIEAPVLYAQTSGTSGSPKYLPVTASGLERIKRAQRMYSVSVAAQTNMLSGKVVGIGSPAIEGHLPGGTPFGSASGMIYEGMPRLVRSKYVIGPEVLAIEDHDARYMAIAALALAEPDVSGFATANPSTLLRLHSIIVDHFDELVTAVERGELGFVQRLSRTQQQELRDFLTPDLARADHLRSLHSRHGRNLTYGHIWPDLNAITTWTGGSCGFAVDALRELLSPATHIVELGYSASEVRGAIGVDTETNTAAPLLGDNWFEFVERHIRESRDGVLVPDDFLDLCELEQGKQYYVYVTTLDGLYRYDMNDVVEVTGMFENTPSISFVQKGQGVTNITGEKLCESQMLEAVSHAQTELGLTTSFFVALADEANAHYRLYVEHGDEPYYGPRMAELVDQKLGELNIEYKSKRSSGRLGPLVGFDLVSGTAELYRSELVKAGQRDAQFKYLQVQNLADCPFSFDSHIKASAVR